MRFSDKVAFITGASRGIGEALALGLAREGCHIVVAAKSETEHAILPGTIYEVARKVEALGRQALPLKLDVREEASVNAAVEAARERFGRIDFLLNNAGAIFLADVETMPIKRFDLVMQVNVRGAYLCSRAVIPAMKAQGGGHIVMMSPPMQHKAPGKTGYALSKFGMTFVAHSLADELREHRIAVNALWPVTAVESQATKHWWPGTEENWRKADVLVDATIELLAKSADEMTGQALYDEDLLRRAGVTDFDRYAVVPGSKPAAWSRDMMLVEGGSPLDQAAS